MADEEKREETSEEESTRDRSYMRTWGSTRQNKQAFEDAHIDDGKISEEDAAKLEAKRPGVNPVVSPEVDFQGKALK